MPPKKKKPTGASDRPRDQPSLLVAFAKQIKLQKCTVCSREFASGVFAAHFRQCKVKDDDDECQVVFTQTAEEKWAAGLITLDGEENAVRVKREGETPTTNRDRQNKQSTQRRRAKKRQIGAGEGDGGESGEDSSFAFPSQESAEAEETISKREEPVRTRRSARVALQQDEPPSTDEFESAVDAATAAEEEEEEMDEGGFNLDATIREHEWMDEEEEEEEEGKEMEEEEEEEVAAAAATPPSRRLTRSAAANSQSSSLDNQVFFDRVTPSPPETQTSSMEVETGFISNFNRQSAQKEKRSKRRVQREEEKEEEEEEVIELDVTLPPEEEPAATRSRRRGGKDTVDDDSRPLIQKTRLTRRSMNEALQSSQSSQEIVGSRSRRKEREEERKKKEEETKRREVEETERRKKEQREKEKKKKEEDEKKRKEEEERKKEEERGKDKPIAGLTKIVLRALEDKCIRHEMGLVPSQELVQAAVINLLEEDPEVVPHYVYLVCKIMRKVLSSRTVDGRVHDEGFWGEDMRMIQRFLSLKDDAKLLFIRLFTRKRGWHSPDKLKEKYPYLKLRVDGALGELMKDGFLENGKTALSSTEETLRLCALDKLKLIAKDFRVDSHKPKPALVSALLESATSQRQLFVSGTPGNTGRLLMVAKKHLGPVYRITSSSNSFFRALFSLYSPFFTDSIQVAEDRTTNIISHMMFRMKEIHYGSTQRRAPFPCDSIIGVYENKEDLYEFVAAKESEERLLRALDRHDIKEAVEEAEKAREKLREMKRSRIDYLRSLPVHHLQYTTEAVLTRIVGRGVDCLERKKDYIAACNWIKFILDHEMRPSLVRHAVGALYERLALDLHHHCHQSEEAIDEIKRALEDPLVPAKHRLNLDDRARRILKDKWESRFSLIPPTEIVVVGETIGRDLGDERKNRFVRTSENGDVEEISVEQVARGYFLSQGMEDGLHSEGEIWHLATKLLFWDVIYAPHIDGVWLCELQVAPIDYDYSLYEARKEAFEERFQWLRNSSEADRFSMVDQYWHGEIITMGEMKAFLTACDLVTLIGVMEIIVKEPRHRRSGFPDLVLWSAAKRVITVAEVKGPGDILSCKQRLWLDFFMKQDKERVKAYLCKVTASGRRRLQ